MSQGNIGKYHVVVDFSKTQTVGTVLDLETGDVVTAPFENASYNIEEQSQAIKAAREEAVNPEA